MGGRVATRQNCASTSAETSTKASCDALMIGKTHFPSPYLCRNQTITGPDGEFRRTLIHLLQRAPKLNDMPYLFSSGERVSEEEHFEDLGRSTFCLCPPGFSRWSFRLVESILAGCIPVLFSVPHETQVGESVPDMIMLLSDSCNLKWPLNRHSRDLIC